MWYKRIADSVLDTLLLDMDVYSALDELECMIDELPMPRYIELVEALTDKLHEIRCSNGLSECCGAEVNYSISHEFHEELDDGSYETFHDQWCSECGKEV